MLEFIEYIVTFLFYYGILVAGNAIGLQWKIDLVKFTENIASECANKVRPYWNYIKEHRIYKELLSTISSRLGGKVEAKVEPSRKVE